MNSRRRLSRLAMRCVHEAAVLLFPSRCFACDRPLPRVQLLGACMACWASLARGPCLRCRRCALPLPLAADESGPALSCCARCAVSPLPFDRAIAAVPYDAQARRFLLRAKEGHRPELLVPLGRQLAAVVVASGLLGDVDAVVPVPSSVLARWRRGFDPGGVLAAELATVVGRPLLPRVLRRRGLGGPAAKALSATARWVRAGRYVSAERGVRGARILLVDDVLTTGATASACSHALRAAGAESVRIAIWARTPSRANDFGRSPGKLL
jgi:predicted amidophosphoribosyltransferase